MIACDDLIGPGWSRYDVPRKDGSNRVDSYFLSPAGPNQVKLRSISSARQHHQANSSVTVDDLSSSIKSVNDAGNSNTSKFARLNDPYNDTSGSDDDVKNDDLRVHSVRKCRRVQRTRSQVLEDSDANDGNSDDGGSYEQDVAANANAGKLANSVYSEDMPKQSDHEESEDESSVMSDSSDNTDILYDYSPAEIPTEDAFASTYERRCREFYYDNNLMELSDNHSTGVLETLVTLFAEEGSSDFDSLKRILKYLRKQMKTRNTASGVPLTLSQKLALSDL